MKKKIQHDYVCDECGEPATRNVQNWWHEYEIKPSGKMIEINDWEGDTNEFYCDKCNEERE
jgi:hypothetical protein